MSASITKSESSNYYRILGTNSNADDELIKKRYLERVRAFQPEKDPEEFKRIREAYDTLRDPFKRSEYDLKTKYQGKANKLMEDAILYIDMEEYDLAETLLSEALELAADNIYILRVFTKLALAQKNLAKFYSFFEQIEEIVPDSKKDLVLFNKADMLIKENYIKQAIKITNKLETLFPEKIPDMLDLFLRIYDRQNNFDKIWDLLSERLKNMKDCSEDNFHIFITTISLIDKYEKWEKKDFLIQNTHSFIEGVKEDEVLRDTYINVLQDIINEAEEYMAVESQLFNIDLLLLVIKDHQLLERREMLRLIIKIQEELKDIADKGIISSFVFYQAASMFFDLAYPEQPLGKFLDVPSKMQMNMFKRDYVQNYASIEILEDSYPDIYLLFEEEWSEIKDECFHHLNERQLGLLDNQLKIDENSDYERLNTGQIIKKKKIGRNDPCPCGSGKKYKNCCGR
jgi:curved DNA-binding protein CbpA